MAAPVPQAPAHTAIAESGNGNEFLIEVLPEVEGAPLWVVNQSAPSAFFDNAINELPGGTRVANIDTGTETVVR